MITWYHDPHVVTQNANSGYRLDIHLRNNQNRKFDKHIPPALTNSFRKENGISGSFNVRRKNFIKLQITWMSSFLCSAWKCDAIGSIYERVKQTNILPSLDILSPA